MQQTPDPEQRIPRIVVLIGDEGIGETAVLSDMPIKYVIVSDSTNEVEQCSDLDAVGDLDDMFKVGKDAEDEDKSVVLNGPHHRDPDPHYVGIIDKYWQQAPYFSGALPEPSSQPISGAISEPISGAISGAKSGQKSGPEIELKIVIRVEDEDSPDASYLEQEGWEERRAAYERGDFHFIGICVDAHVQVAGHRSTWHTSSGGLWGIESDSDGQYLWSVAEAEIMELREDILAQGISEEQFAGAMADALGEHQGGWLDGPDEATPGTVSEPISKDDPAQSDWLKVIREKARIRVAYHRAEPRQSDGTVVVLAYDPSGVQPWITWLWSKHREELFWGHYWHSETDARRDYQRRVEA